MINKKCIFCIQTIGISSRIKILEYLKKGKKKVTVNDIVSYMSLRQPTITFHLNKLVKIQLVKKTKVGRTVYCSLDKPRKRCASCPLFA